MMQRFTAYLLATTALLPLLLMPVAGNPLDPNVVAGDANISGTGTAAVTVNQSTNKAIIDWRTFDIDPGESTRFIQPGSQSVTLNRVTGGQGASNILGALQANGQVFLINPGGILIGKDANIDVGGLVATTQDILNDDFLAGSYSFSQPGNANAAVVNLGTITVEDGGFAALVAPGVRNSGVIRANLGKIALASANAFTLDFFGDELIKLAVSDTTAGAVIDLETGQTLQDLVSNSGLLSANGGSVQLTASAARAVVNSVINNTGNIEADTVGTRNGKIILGASTAATKPAGAPNQTVRVSGTLSAAGADAGETGGEIRLTGELIELTVATIDAFGWNGGGKILIGGDYMGGNGDPKTVAEYDIALEPGVVPTASYVLADELTSINASALGDGNGGKIILWSDIATVTAAAIQAKGGASSGDGGFIETSGKYLSVLAPADASAVNGTGGWWLIDPLDVHLRRAALQNLQVTSQKIYAGITGDNAVPIGSPSVINIADIEFSLNNGTNQRVTTRGTVGGQPGDIYVEDDIRKTAGGDVFAIIDSARNVYFTSGIDLVSTAGKVFFHVYARDGIVTGSKVRVDVNGGQFLVIQKDVPADGGLGGLSVRQVADLQRQLNAALLALQQVQKLYDQLYGSALPIVMPQPPASTVEVSAASPLVFGPVQDGAAGITAPVSPGAFSDAAKKAIADAGKKALADLAKGPLSESEEYDILLNYAIKRALSADLGAVAKENAPYAVFASNVYGSNELILDEYLDVGWSRIQTSDSLFGEFTGFNARTYVRQEDGVTKEVVVAFGGTNAHGPEVPFPLIDKITEFGQDLIFGSALTPIQRLQAITYAENAFAPFANQTGVTFTTTGDSLGGALAIVAADVYGTNVKAVTFSSAPLLANMLGLIRVPVTSIAETGELLRFTRLNTKKDILFNNIEGFGPVMNHTSINLMARTMAAIASNY